MRVAAAPMHRDGEGIGGQFGVQQHEVAVVEKLMGQLAGNRVGHEHPQIRMAHDARQGQEGGGHELDLTVQARGAQHLQGLCVRPHGHHLEALHAPQAQHRAFELGGDRVAFSQQHPVAVRQQLLAERALELGQKADGQVEVATVQGHADLGLRPGFRPHLDARGGLPQFGHQLGQKAGLADVGQVQAQLGAGAPGIEGVARCQPGLEVGQAGLYRAGQIVGPGGGPHPAPRALEQGVAQRQPQAREGLAGRGLGQAQLLGGAAHVAGSIDHIEDPQQVQVELFH